MSHRLLASATIVFAVVAPVAFGAQYTVDKIYDNGDPGTLRWALERAENDGTNSTIVFSGVDDVWLSASQGPLPDVRAGQLFLDGSTAPSGRVTLHFDGQSSLGGFWVKSANNTIINLTLERSKGGFGLSGARSSVVDGVRSIDGAGNNAGFSILSSNSNAIRRCHSIRNRGQGFVLSSNSDDNEISDCVIEDNGNAGIAVVDGSSHNRIFGNQIRRNDGNGIGLHVGCPSNTVGPGNRIEWSQGAGVVIQSADNVIQGNSILEATTFGIQATPGSHRTEVKTNRIARTELTSVFFNDCDDVVVKSNVIAWSRTAYGISMDHCSDALIGPGNLVALNHLGGINLDTCDPSAVAGGNNILVNFGPGVLIQTDRAPGAQQRIDVVGNHIQLNESGFAIVDNVARVNIEANLITQNVGLGIGISNSSSAHRDTGITIRGNFIGSNGAEGIASFWAGGYTVEKNIISGHQAHGITVQQYAEGIRIIDNLVEENPGVAVHFIRADGALVESNRVINNGGFGIALNETRTDVVNNVVWRNTLSGIQVSHGNHDARIVNNTIVENGAGVDGGGYLRNNIIWGNSGVDVVHSDMLDIDYCLLGTYLCGQPGGTHNIFDTPRFEDSSRGDFHLTAASPGLNAGTNGARGLPDLDFDFESRILEGRVDMGADEYTTGIFADGGPSHHRIPGGLHPNVFGKRMTQQRAETSIARNPLVSALYQSMLHSFGRIGPAGNNPKTYTVTNLDDKGEGSLRAALIKARADLGPSRIEFQSGLRGTIWLDNTLPAFADLWGGTNLEGPLLGDGVTPAIRVQLKNGTRATAIAIRSDGNTIRNLIVDASFDAFVLQGSARYNTIENVEVVDSDHGLGIGMTGADNNYFRNVVSRGHKDPAFSIAFSANDNVFENITCASTDETIGISLLGSSRNTFRSVGGFQSGVTDCRWAVAVKSGSKNNTFGPDFYIHDSGGAYSGMGILINGLLADDNLFQGIVVTQTRGSGIFIDDWCKGNHFEGVEVYDSSQTTFYTEGARETVISGGVYDGNANQSRPVISFNACSDDSIVQNATIRGNGVLSQGVKVSWSQDVQVNDCVIRGTFASWGSGIQFDNAPRSAARRNTIGTAQGSSPDRGIYVNGSPDCLLRSNIVYSGNGNGNAFDVGFQIEDGSHRTILNGGNTVIATNHEARYGALLGDSDDLFLADTRVEGGFWTESGLHAANAGRRLTLLASSIKDCNEYGIMVDSEPTHYVYDNQVTGCGIAIHAPMNANSQKPTVAFNTVVCNDTGIKGDMRAWFNISWANNRDHWFDSKADVHCNNFGSTSGLPADNVSYDPQFVRFNGCGAQDNDLHLRNSSPLIDFPCSGNPPPFPNRDIDGQSRQLGPAYDIGYDEAR